MKKRYFIFLVLVFLFFLASSVRVNFVYAQETTRCDAQEGFCQTRTSGLMPAVSHNKLVSLPLIVGAGLVDGVNPCAIGLMILLLGCLIVFIKKPKRMLPLGLAYIITIFITYFLIGFVFSKFATHLISLPYYHRVGKIIKAVIVGIIIIAGLINIKDFFWYRKGFSLGITRKQMPILQKYVMKASLPAIIVLGILVTLFEMPCSLPLYIGSIAIITQSLSQLSVISYLLIYNLMFVLPLILLLIVIVSTKKIFILKDWQERANKYMKLSMGLVQIAIGLILWFYH